MGGWVAGSTAFDFDLRLVIPAGTTVQGRHAFLPEDVTALWSLVPQAEHGASRPWQDDRTHGQSYRSARQKATGGIPRIRRLTAKARSRRTAKTLLADVPHDGGFRAGELDGTLNRRRVFEDGHRHFVGPERGEAPLVPVHTRVSIPAICGALLQVL